MEDPIFHWEVVGEASGNTLKEVADNVSAKDPEFAKYYDPNTLTFWGWQLSLNPNEVLT